MRYIDMFLDFIRQNPDTQVEIKRLCIQAYEEWGNLSGPRIQEIIEYVANQHNPSGTALNVDSYKDAWENYHDEILASVRNYSVNTYSPKSPRHQVILDKTLSALQIHNTSIASIGDFGSGITFGPLENLIRLLKEHGMAIPTEIQAFDIFPAQYVSRKDIDGIPLIYTQQDISASLFTSSTTPVLDFSMSLSVLPHLRSAKRVEIIKGMLRKSPAVLIEGSIYGRNYWDEENPSDLLPRSPTSKHNGYLFTKNQNGGLDFQPLTSKTMNT